MDQGALMGIDLTQATFTAGELAPSLHKRADLARYRAGLKLCQNFFIHPHGGVSNRTGYEFIVGCQHPSKQARLIPFSFSTQDTYMLEFGHLYMRVVRQGGQVLLPSVPADYDGATTYAMADHVAVGGSYYYSRQDNNTGNAPGGASSHWHRLSADVVEIPTPYTETQLARLAFVQSADIITLVHPEHPVKELSRLDHHQWKLEDVSFSPQIATPTGLDVTKTGTGSGRDYKYKVTAVAAETLEESLPSAETSKNHTKSLDQDNYNTVTWNAVAGAEKYYVYKEENGLFGFIGITESTSFQDDGYKPDLSDTPPQDRNPFVGAGNYPSTVTYYEQRLVLAATRNDPEAIWFSKTGNFHNMSVSSPAKDDDAITVRLNAAQVNEVRHLVPLSDLVALTSGAEWKITSGDQAFAFPNMKRKPQGFRGSANLEPLLIGNTVLHVTPKQSTVRDLSYALESDGYAGRDLSVMSRHLFEGYSLVSWAFAEEPDSIVWAVRSDGVLLGFTYMREHEVWGWHQHHTDGKVEDVCVVSEGDVDAVYLVVNRTINGSERRYIERLRKRDFAAVEDCFFVDSGLTYDGAATDSLSGLEHLEGKTLVALCDGHVVRNLTVSAGAVSLPRAYAKIHIGLPYQANLETLEPPLEQGTVKKKSVPRVTVAVSQSRAIKAGPDQANLVEAKQRSNELWGAPIALRDGDFEVPIPASWQNKGSVYLRQDDPLPLSILAVTPEVVVGG